MAQVIIFTRPSGTVSIMAPGTGYTIQDAWATVPVDAINAEIIDSADVPTDRTFRNAWRQGNGNVHVDMPEARNLHMAKIREARNAKLDQVDKDFQKADDNNDGPGKAQLRSQRQTLRNLPATVDLDQFDNPDDLKNFWPTKLND